MAGRRQCSQLNRLPDFWLGPSRSHSWESRLSSLAPLWCRKARLHTEMADGAVMTDTPSQSLGPYPPSLPPCPTCHHHHHTWWETPILGMPSVVCQHQFICSWSVPYFITFWCWKGIYTDFRGVLVRSSLPFQMELSLFSFSCTRYPESSFLNFLYLIILSFHVFNSLSFPSWKPFLGNPRKGFHEGKAYIEVFIL